MSTSADFPSFQYSTTNYNKSSAQEARDDQFFDKENCNVHQPKTSQRLPFQPKIMNTSALSERMEELSYQSTIDCSVDFDQISRFSEDFALPSNFLEPTGLKVCLHMNTTTRRCTYCKDCGIFIPRNGSIAYRENMYADKLTICPDEVYETMLKHQTRNRSYDPNASHVQFRKTITDWIFQVSQDLKVSPDTTCAIISYIDTILCRVEVAKESLQLVILSCLILATKFSETDDKVPPLREAYNLCQGTYSIDAFKRAENFILEQLDWNLKTISPYQYIHHFLSKGCIFSSDKTVFSSVDADALKHLRRYAECFVNLSLDDYEFNQFTSHAVACAAIASSRKLIGVTPVWNSELEELTGTSWEIIEPCFDKLYSVFEAAFPELLGFQKLPSKPTATSEEAQNEDQENSNCNIEISSRPKSTPTKGVYKKVICKSTSSGKKKDVPTNKKEIKRKNLSRFAKKSDTGNKQTQNKVNLNTETSDEFFDNGERNGSIKRNLIY